jgi:peptidyl-prolyl cis-trans isomerase D
MLDIMRRQKRLKSILWLVILSLALGMLLFFVPGMNDSSGRRDTYAAIVDGRSIPMSDFIEKYSQMVKYYSRSSGRNLDAETLKALGLSRNVLDQLINGKVEEIMADRLGIDVTDAEVQNAIETNPGLQEQGRFIGIEQYKARLASNDLSIAEFEKNVRLQILDRKLHNVFADSLGVNDRELKEEFSRTNQETQVSYVVLKKDDFKKRVKPAEADLQAYFETHKEAYNVKEKRRIQYLLIRTSQIAPGIKVSEQEIKQDWDKTPHPETVTAAHIMIRPTDPSKDAEAKASAENVLKMAKSGKDFGELAKTYSRDDSTKNKGGVLPVFSRGQGIVPKEFEDVVFSMKPNEIGLVRTVDGYHVIKLLKHDIPSFEASRSEILNRLQQAKAKEQAKLKAEEAAAAAQKQKDLVSIGKSLGEIAEIRETKPFGKEENAFQFDISEELKDEAFELKEVNAIGKTVEHTLGYAIPKLLEVQMARPGQFAESRPQVERDFVESKARDLMQAEAKKISEDAGKQGSLEKVAKELNWNVKTSQPFKYGGTPDQEIGANNPAFNSAAFELPVGGVSSPVALMDNIAVLQVKSRTPFDEAAFQKGKPQLKEKLVATKEEPYFQECLAKVLDELGKKGKIKINQSAYDEAPRY